jgi:cyclophilin family peptidyl-prolyl cis-trans isomerase
VAKFGAIPDLFEGGPSSTQNYRAKSRGNSINLKKVPNEFKKNLKLGGCFTKGIWGMTRLAWLRTAGRQIFFVFNKYNFLEKLA